MPLLNQLIEILLIEVACMKGAYKSTPTTAVRVDATCKSQLHEIDPLEWHCFVLRSLAAPHLDFAVVL